MLWSSVCGGSPTFFCHVDFRLRITLKLASALRVFRRKRPDGLTTGQTGLLLHRCRGEQRASPRCVRCRRRWLRSSQVIRCCCWWCCCCWDSLVLLWRTLFFLKKKWGSKVFKRLSHTSVKSNFPLPESEREHVSALIKRRNALVPVLFARARDWTRGMRPAAAAKQNFHHQQ